MSERGISILLPGASVAVFSKAAKTREAARFLSDDWRFARVDVSVEEGDVDDAIAGYEDSSSPDLLIIQTDSVGDDFVEKLIALAEYCHEGTSAIIVGPENDVNLYRKLIDMGVSDYLVHPISGEDLADVVARALIEKKGASESRLIALIGSKGGVGTTVLSEILARCSADILNQKTVLLDIAGGWSTLGVGMDFEPVTTLPEAVKAAESSNEDNLKRMLHSVNENLRVLATGGDVMLEQGVSPAQLEGLLDKLMLKMPVVIVDLSDASEALQKAVLARAHQIYMVAMPLLPSLRLARSLLQEIRQMRGGKTAPVKLIVNMQGLASAQEVPKKDIEAALDYPVSAFVPFDPKALLGCECEGKNIVEGKEGRALIDTTLLPLLKEALDSDVDIDSSAQSSDKAGFLGALLSKLSGGS
ncbi:MAG: type II secretion protein ATPase [Alphaproteobacteria bacterium]|nr:type II secretion protein ATPase [Alphaproteobacteria bacterium]